MTLSFRCSPAILLSEWTRTAVRGIIIQQPPKLGFMHFEFIIWDPDDDSEGNVQRCGEHGVTKGEVEEIFENPIDEDTSHSSGRPVIFGDTSTGRHLMVVYEQIDPDTVYPVTAYEVLRRKRS
jgi:uncharacterized DUF497 family protein